MRKAGSQNYISGDRYFYWVQIGLRKDITSKMKVKSSFDRLRRLIIGI